MEMALAPSSWLCGDGGIIPFISCTVFILPSTFYWSYFHHLNQYALCASCHIQGSRRCLFISDFDTKSRTPEPLDMQHFLARHVMQNRLRLQRNLLKLLTHHLKKVNGSIFLAIFCIKKWDFFSMFFGSWWMLSFVFCICAVLAQWVSTIPDTVVDVHF